VQAFVRRNPIWSAVIGFALAIVLWLVLAPWSEGMEAALGRKRVFLNAFFGGITLGALYFLVASGFTLIFGLMRNVNLAHGSLYLLGGYLGYEISERTGSWLIAFPAVFVIVALLGMLLQNQVFRRMEGEELRQTMVTIGLSVVLADLMLWVWGGQSYTIITPDFLSGPAELPIVAGTDRAGETVYLRYPAVRIAILIAAIVVGIAMWLVLNRTKLGMLVRAGVDDRDMLAASGIRIQYVFLVVFAFGAGLAGVAGIVGGTFQSLSPGRGYALSARQPRRRHRRRHGLDPRRGDRGGADRAFRADGPRLRADLFGGLHLPDHGRRAGVSSAGPSGEGAVMAVSEPSAQAVVPVAAPRRCRPGPSACTPRSGRWVSCCSSCRSLPTTSGSSRSSAGPSSSASSR
jgi:branched-chain amino acid transport system permease protein